MIDTKYSLWLGRLLVHERRQRRSAGWLALGLATAFLLLRGGYLRAEPADAVVCIVSHGCSGTVVATGPGQTWVLTCAHAFRGNDRSKPVVLDAPAPAGRAPRVTNARPTVWKIDTEADLCLIEMTTGPLPFYLPVGERQPLAGEQVVAVGYEKMVKPAAVKPTTVLDVGPHWQHTRERPIPGMSGGPLIEPKSGALVGTCTGYESQGERRGMYVRLSAVRAFMGLDAKPVAPGSGPRLPPLLPPGGT
jgi:hypothetical protein